MRDAERGGIPSLPGPEKVEYRVKAGQKGGRKGGRSRAANLTPEQRQDISRKAAKARWDKKQ